MDGVLIRLAKDHFWYVQANGEFQSWLMAFSHGMDVTISDPKSWVLQVQGPNAMKVLDAATDGGAVENFGYFHARMVSFLGQQHLITRTGWTGEAGFEIYSNANTDHLALWDHLMACGEPYGLATASLASMGLRRIEAGILDNGTDIDTTMTPFEAGLNNVGIGDNEAICLPNHTRPAALIASAVADLDEIRPNLVNHPRQLVI